MGAADEPARPSDPASGETPVSGELLRDPAATIADLIAVVKVIEQESRQAGVPEGAEMRSDTEIRADVIPELEWDPRVSGASAIGVAVQDGAVTLTGNVPSYAEKVAAARAAARVHGVRAVADEIRVRLSDETRDDAGIAQAIAHVFESNTQIPDDKADARVQAGWVVLHGQVDCDYQRHEVERMVRHVRGVIGITNDISVAPTASAVAVQAEIEAAFRRGAEVDAQQVRVEISDHTATLYGQVQSLHEASAAAAAAAAAPGVARGGEPPSGVPCGLKAGPGHGLFGNQRRELHPRADIELPEDVAQVKCDRVSAQEDLIGDLAVAEALGHEFGDAALGLGQAPPAERRTVGALPVPHPNAGQPEL
jgi:osmotically-inducible protein OsmY